MARREPTPPKPAQGPPAQPGPSPEDRAADYQAFAFVLTPDYAYWNPVPGTRAGSKAECRALAEAYAQRTFVAPRYPAWRSARFLRELEVRLTPRGHGATARISCRRRHASSIRGGAADEVADKPP